VPGQKSVGSNDAGKPGEEFSPDRLGLGSEATTLIVVAAWLPAQLLLEHPNLLLEVFDHELLAVIHPARKTNKKKV
jgi:hypothetical protein